MGRLLIHPVAGPCVTRAVTAIAASLLLLLGVSAQAAPSTLGPDAGSTAPPCGMGNGAGWGAMPMGQRSADSRFIVMMVPHHEGAIAMAELALVRSKRPEILALAQRIRSSQSRENALMRRWYRQWNGRALPDRPDQAWSWGMGMGMPGFSTSLEALRLAPDFDRTFLEQMIAHHRMGVMMASHAQWNTVHPELRALEAAMVRVQSEEITQMAGWYRQWFGGVLR